MRRIVFALSLLVGTGACRSPTACTLEAVSSFKVTVVDSISGENLAPEATVRVREGAFQDTLMSIGDSYIGAFERAGVYEVVARHPDYEDWRRTNVRVLENECHVITRELTARMKSRP